MLTIYDSYDSIIKSINRQIGPNDEALRTIEIFWH
jgi:hypothetical protein